MLYDSLPRLKTEECLRKREGYICIISDIMHLYSYYQYLHEYNTILSYPSSRLSNILRSSYFTASVLHTHIFLVKGNNIMGGATKIKRKRST